MVGLTGSVTDTGDVPTLAPLASVNTVAGVVRAVRTFERAIVPATESVALILPVIDTFTLNLHPTPQASITSS